MSEQRAAALSSLSGWDFRAVSQALKAMRQARTPEKRREILAGLEDDNPPNGAELRAIAEAEFQAEWAGRRAGQ